MSKMKRRRAYSSSDEEDDDDDSKAESQQDEEDYGEESQGNNDDPEEETPKWLRYLPQRKYLKIPGKAASVDACTQQCHESTTMTVLRSPRHRTDSTTSLGSEMSDSSFQYVSYNDKAYGRSTEAHLSGEIDTTASLGVCAMDQDDHFDEHLFRAKRRRKRRVTFVEYVELPPIPQVEYADSEASCCSVAVSASAADGVALLFGEDNRASSSSSSASAMIVKPPKRPVSVAEAAMLLSFSDIWESRQCVLYIEINKTSFCI